MKRIVILASGSGTNAENIIKFFQKNKDVKVVQVLSNNKKAKVFERCLALKIKCTYFDKADLNTNDICLNILKENADLVVLAGFLWKIPSKIIEVFPNKIINIHPALLPKYGGKGMYGMNVHKAIKENEEVETGISIHYVNSNYDEGALIFQAKTTIDNNDSPDDIAKKVHLLEHKHFPVIIEDIINKI